MKEKYKIIIHNTFDEEVKKQWLDVENRNRSSVTIFQTFDWQHNWFKYIGNKIGSMAIFIVTKYDNEDCKLIIPMFLKKTFFLNILEFSGYPFSDFNLPISDKDFDSFDIDEIFGLISKKKISNKKIDLIHLKNQPEQINQNKNLFFDLNSFIKTEIIQSYNINTKNYNEANILDQKKLKFLKQDFTRIEKKVSDIEFVISSDKNEKNMIIDYIISKKSDQYDRNNSWNFFKKKNYRNFIKSFLNKNELHVSFLKIDGKIVSAHYGFVYEKIFYYIFPVYDHEFRNLSPGNLLLYRLINSEKKKLNFFDFTIGDETYKKKWSNFIIKTSNDIKIISLIGFLYLFFFKIKKILSKNNFLKNNLRRIYHKFK